MSECTGARELLQLSSSATYTLGRYLNHLPFSPWDRRRQVLAIGSGHGQIVGSLILHCLAADIAIVEPSGGFAFHNCRRELDHYNFDVNQYGIRVSFPIITSDTLEWYLFSQSTFCIEGVILTEALSAWNEELASLYLSHICRIVRRSGILIVIEQISDEKPAQYYLDRIKRTLFGDIEHEVHGNALIVRATSYGY